MPTQRSPGMQSEQEAIIESMLDRSFGAPFLFIPRKYRKGSAHREPADLAWLCNGLVALFYFTRSTAALDQQVEHNLRQAKGYLRLWRTGDATYALRGKNRFGDECHVPFKNVTHHLTFIVVSAPCGIQVFRTSENDKPTLTVVLNESVLSAISEFGGSLVDLLCIVAADIKNKNDSTFEAGSHENRHEQTKRTIAQYVSRAINQADPYRKYFNGNMEKDFQFMLERLQRLRLPSRTGKAIENRENRESFASLFADMQLTEYATLSTLAAEAIALSEPPNFKKWIIARTQNPYHDFVVATVCFGASNTSDIIEEAIAASRPGVDRDEAALFIYGNMYNFNDYRKPIMMGLPSNRKKPQAEHITESLLANHPKDTHA
ncbi:MAG TPA: hypothetical protein VFW93_04915 [Aquabacterium sp.]|uniref:hypothetical protein n=1 Tax=Aquabacterium sp. TaxID=1872578 RepID=UPI002E30E5A9|nr:hypothetical protein [Aquabacterium sp.]HEX5355531.1 hypothetical protein [Aquabacterium sp.]